MKNALSTKLTEFYNDLNEKNALDALGSIKRSIIRDYYKLYNRNTSFTIISNNCTGEAIYEDFDIQYYTPTIGLFFYSECYINFLENLESYLEKPLTFKVESKYEAANLERKDRWYPLGSINGDLEIHFRHYKTEMEALEKWNRRKSRINFDNIFILYSDRDEFNEEHLKRYEKLPYPKLFFSAKERDFDKNWFIYIKEYKNDPCVGNLYQSRLYEKHVNILKWLND